MTGLVLVADWTGTRPPAGLLGPAERAVAERFPDPRRHEWIAARLTARAALRARFGVLPTGLRILPDECGAPVVSGGGRLDGRALSLAHTGPLTACLVDGGSAAVGVDIERRDPRNTVLARRIAAPGETPADDDTFTEIWACKEAAIKACHHESFRGRDYRVTLRDDRAAVAALRSGRMLYGHLLPVAGHDATVAAVAFRPDRPLFAVTDGKTVLERITER